MMVSNLTIEISKRFNSVVSYLSVMTHLSSTLRAAVTILVTAEPDPCSFPFQMVVAIPSCMGLADRYHCSIFRNHKNEKIRAIIGQKN